MIVADSSFIYALLDRGDTHHEAAVEWYQREDPELATTPMIIAEVDHLIQSRGDRPGRVHFLRDLADGVFEVVWPAAMLGTSAATAAQYADLGPSLSDGSLVALAAHFETDRIATFDERHFRAMKPIDGRKAFTILPADASS